VTIVNRDIYPMSEYPYGQWSYMKFYEQSPDTALEQLNSATDRFLKVIYLKSDPEDWGKRAPTSRALEDGGLFGWFGGSPETLQNVPLEMTSLDEELYTLLRDDKRRNGWFPAKAYYHNSDVNAEYDKSRKNEAVLDVPCLYIDSKYDPICSSKISPKFRIPMTKTCRNLTEAYVGAAHWTHLEKPREVNAVLAKWLADQLPYSWPFAQTVPLQRL
jgi:soluble epoxide hydrolase / lipid-phosphate phosphatase